MLNTASALYLKLLYRQRELYLISIKLRGHKTIASD